MPNLLTHSAMKLASDTRMMALAMVLWEADQVTAAPQMVDSRYEIQSFASAPGIVSPIGVNS